MQTQRTPTAFGEPYQEVYVDGEFRPEAAARLSVLANAVSYGTGTFEGIRAYWNDHHQQLYLFEVRAHYARLRRSARILGLPLGLDADQLVAVTVELLRRNQVRTDAYVRPLLLLAQERLFVRMHDIDASLIIAATPITDGYLSGDGLRCQVSSWRRSPDVSTPIRAKVIGSYVGPALAKTEAIRAGYDEAIMLTGDGFVAESTTSNILIRDGEGWFTPVPTDDILAGITLRQAVQLLREDFQTEVSWRRVHRSELYTADEVALCATAATVAPVVAVDGRPVGDGTPGKVSRRLRERLRAIARREDPAHPEWTTPVHPNQQGG